MNHASQQRMAKSEVGRKAVNFHIHPETEEENEAQEAFINEPSVTFTNSQAGHSQTKDSTRKNRNPFRFFKHRQKNLTGTFFCFSKRPDLNIY